MAVQPNGPSGAWTLAWQDEFDDTAGMSGPVNGLASAKWNSGWFTGPTSPGVGNITAITDPTNSALIAYHGPAALLFPGDDAVHLRLEAGVDSGGTFNGRTVESGMINTAGLMALNPASVPVSSSSPDLRPYVVNGPCVLEIKARFPGTDAQAAGYWASFWMTNAGNYSGGSSWPGGQRYLAEIDLVEFYNHGALGSNGRFHFHAASSYGGMSSVPVGLQSTDVSLAYHVYTFQFTQNTIQLWVDGTLVTGVNPDPMQIAAQWQYPQYLMLPFDAIAGANFPTTGSSTPSDFMVDYVRVWNAPVLAGPVFSPFMVHA